MQRLPPPLGHGSGSPNEEKDLMRIFSRKPLSGQPPLPTRELWRALLDIHKYYLLDKLAPHVPEPDGHRRPRRVQEALWLLDCWLDIAVSEGWMDEAHEQVD